MSDFTYQENIVPYSRAELAQKVAANLSESRFQHCLRVEETAIKLAELNHADVERAPIVGLVHDYAKQLPDEVFIEAIHEVGFDPELLQYGNAIWHGVVGAYFIERDLGIHDETILNAVRRHTIGAPEMTVIDQILFVADFIEPGRDFPGVVQARETAFADLAAGVRFEILNTLTFLIEGQKKIYPKTIDTYNAWVPTQAH
ncbi:bis(5'-nucleosyl)-tetraphosphatase (symmetrical) YqeK [Latilactobacillus sakei]